MSHEQQLHHLHRISAPQRRVVQRSTDASGPILRRAAHGAILHDARVEIGFDRARGEYVLGLTTRS